MKAEVVLTSPGKPIFKGDISGCGGAAEWAANNSFLTPNPNGSSRDGRVRFRRRRRRLLEQCLATLPCPWTPNRQTGTVVNGYVCSLNLFLCW